MKFYNVTKDQATDVAVEEIEGRWYIKMGFCGFNTPANNGLGYSSKARAEGVILRYQSKSEYIQEKMKRGS